MKKVSCTCTYKCKCTYHPTFLPLLLKLLDHYYFYLFISLHTHSHLLCMLLFISHFSLSVHISSFYHILFHHVFYSHITAFHFSHASSFPIYFVIATHPSLSPFHRIILPHLSDYSTHPLLLTTVLSLTFIPSLSFLPSLSSRYIFIFVLYIFNMIYNY